MKLIIGGAFQGKLEYAQKLTGTQGWIDGENCGSEDIYRCTGIAHFHLYVKRFPEQTENLVKRLREENPQICIVSNELGYGIVPVDAGDRAWRELTGRICTRIAEQAEEVHRVVCGIGMVMKP